MTTPRPTDQRAGIRPISFVLQNGGSFSAPVTLQVRPEDLTRTEPSRTTVHQTLGRETQGWVDNFGAGLPSCVISGHTGWRSRAGSGQDGAQHFETLNHLVHRDYHAAKQAAIDTGRDPATVKLIFVDMLDNFTWSVTPENFVLRRSRSRPLLFQYNITLQAIDTAIDNPLRLLPSFGNLATGLNSLDRAIAQLWSFASDVEGWVGQAVGFVEATAAPVAATIKRFVEISGEIMDITRSVTGSINNGASRIANVAIGLANDAALVGRNVFWTISSIAGVPSHVKAALNRVASTYNELACILRNSLRPRESYDDFSGLFGASNCSSTTFGRAPSPYAGERIFELLSEERTPLIMSSEGLSSMGELARMDPVLAPMTSGEIERHLLNVNEGFTRE